MSNKFFYEKFESLYFYHGSTENWKMKGFHIHHQYEIILFLCDGATLEVGNRCYQVQSGDLFFLDNKEYHRSSGAVGRQYNRYVLMFEPEILLAGEKAMGYEFSKFFRDRPEHFFHRLHLEKNMLAAVERKFDAVGRIANDKNAYAHDVKISLAILDLVLTLNERYDFFIRKGYDGGDYTVHEPELKRIVSQSDRIEQIKDYVAEHITEKLEVNEIARKFYISNYYLSHHFKQETGFTLLEYITDQKILAAERLLKKGYSVTDVASRLAYNSDSHFIATFRKMTGITPKKFAAEDSKNI